MWNLLRRLLSSTPIAPKTSLRKSRPALESLEVRLNPSWGSIAPAILPNPSSFVTLTTSTPRPAAITNNEVDSYRFTAPSTGRFTIQTQTPNSVLDTVLGVYTTNRVRLASNDDANSDVRTSSITLDMVRGRSYFIGVSNYSGTGGGSYSLLVTGPQAASSVTTQTMSAEQISTWYNQNLKDADLRELVRNSNADGSLSRAEVLSVFTQVEADNTISANELADLRTVVSNTTIVRMTDSVRNLAKKVVFGDRANANYQGEALGNLTSSSTTEQLEKLVNKWFLGLDRPQANARYAQVAGSLFATNGPSYEDIAQGQVGNCYFLAALGSVVKQSPQQIRTMFLDNGDNTYTVRFYTNGKTDYVTVDRSLPARRGLFHYANMGDNINSQDNILWVALAEKAYAQINESGRLGRTTAENSYSALSSGYVSHAITQVTGQRTSYEFVNTTSFATLKSRFDAGKFVAFGSNYETASNIAPTHAYTMIGYDAATQTVTMFNPWGVEGGTSGGVFKSGILRLTMAQLRANFDAVYFSV
jgi:hypothetical protein